MNGISARVQRFQEESEMANMDDDKGHEEQEAQGKEKSGQNVIIISKRRQKRRLRTSEEDAILTGMMGEKKSWTAISRSIIGRSNIDCKDRYRNMTK